MSDPLDSVIHAVDLYRTGKVPARSASGAAQSSLADQRILRAVVQRPRAAQFIFRHLFSHSVRRDHRVIAPAVVSAKVLPDPKLFEPVTDLGTERMGTVIPYRDEHDILRVIDQRVQIGQNIVVPERQVARHCCSTVLASGSAYRDRGQRGVLKVEQGQIRFRLVNTLTGLFHKDLACVRSVIDPQFHSPDLFLDILDIAEPERHRSVRGVVPVHGEPRLRKHSLRSEELLAVDIDIRQFDHEVRSLFHLLCDIVETVLLDQRIPRGKKVRPESQPVAVNDASQRGQCRGELVHRRVGSGPPGIRRFRSGIDERRIDLPFVCIRDISAEIAVHRRVVAAQNYCCILVKILLHDPSDERADLSAGAGDRVGIVVSRILLFIAETADIPVLEMRVHSQQREIERLVRGRQVREPFPCRREELFVFHSPEYIVILRDDPLFHCPDVIVDLVIPMRAEIQAPSAKRRVRPEHEHVPVAVLLKDVSQVRHFLKEGVLRIHFIEGPSLIRELLSDIDL